MSVCTALEGSIRLFLSRLPARGSNSPHPAAGARFDSSNYGASNLASKRSVEADRLPDHHPKKEVLLFFRRRPGCFRLPFACPEETLRTLTLPWDTTHPLACRQSALYTEPHGSVYGTVLDASFAALSDATRRGVLEQLGRADASITDLAEKFHMTLTGMKKHVGVLEQAGLVTTEKVGRVRTCKLGLRGLEEEAAWIERYRQRWAARFDELDKLVEELKQKEKSDGRKKR